MTALIATYRLQLHAGFGFDSAVGILDDLAALGVSHVYCSPILQAVPGSTHGYDVIDPTRVSDDLGGPAGFDRFCNAVRERGMGIVVDIVPNHMAIGSPGNPWWWDVLENGPSSRYAAYFDVDWTPSAGDDTNRVLLPVLGNHLGRVIEAGELRVERDGGVFTVRYHEHQFPVAPRSLELLLAPPAEACASAELGFLADSFARLPSPLTRDARALERRHRDKEVLRAQLSELCMTDATIAAAIDDTVRELNARPDAMEALLARQNYRLAFWRMAEQELGYRRFFDINTLIGLRAEDARVFADTHRLVLGWLRRGEIDGVRIDHVDGLRDPQGYLSRLRTAAPDAWIVVEKIVEGEERLPTSWPVDGTTGYDFLNDAGGLFVDPAGEAPLTELYAAFTGQPTDYADVVREQKRKVLRDVLGSDVNRLTALLREITRQNRLHCDYPRSQLESAVRELAAAFPVYRSYVREDAPHASEQDERFVTAAVEDARSHNPDADPALYEFLRDLLLLRTRDELATEFALRFQQLTGPAMAKGAEDTTFYCFNRFAALNEVGGEPGRWGTSADAFHEHCIRAVSAHPRRMLATSSHDTKRSEDVRARLYVLSEIPGEWARAVRRWAEMNERHRRSDFPDRNAEYLLYQTLVGAWPIETERVLAYMEKAAREAKQHTSWTAINTDYESALNGFVAAVVADDAFRRDLQTFVEPLIVPGFLNSLSQTLIKLTAPGVPDFYQGTELWDFSLVDPDNRRPVDFERRRRLAAEARDLAPEIAMQRLDDGVPKLWLIRRVLHYRRMHPHAFDAPGDYRPLHAAGERKEHVIAFVHGVSAVTIAPRRPIGLKNGWGDTTLELPAGRWQNVLTGDVVSGGAASVSDLLARFPVALLSNDS